MSVLGSACHQYLGEERRGEERREKEKGRVEREERRGVEKQREAEGRGLES
jgi:hypothetical protein